MEEKPQSWKKISAISQASRNPDKMSVTMVRSHHQQDEDETEIEQDNITKGNKIHSCESHARDKGIKLGHQSVFRSFIGIFCINS